MVTGRKRLVFVIPTLGGGGAEKAVLTLAGHLGRLGHDIHIVLLADRIEYTLEEEYSVHIVTESGKITHQKMVDCWLLGAKLRRVVGKINRECGAIDAVFSNLCDADRIVSIAGLARCIYVIHNTLSVELGTMNWRMGKIKRRDKRYWRIYNGKRLIAVSEGVAKDLVRQDYSCVEDVMTIYNGFDIAFIRRMADQPCEHTPKERYIIYVGRVSTQKRIDVLLSAFAMLSTPCKLVMLTKPTEKLYELMRGYAVEDKVILPGFQNNPYCWMKHARLLVLSSDYEGNPSVVVEALICGTPVVSTDCPSGPNEILTGELARWLVPPGNSDLLARKIDEALQSEIDLGSFDAGRFDVEAVAQEYLKTIDYYFGNQEA